MPYTLKPEEVRAKYGKMFCKGFYTIVDEKNGVAQIIETCTARGPIEWDIVNRKRTGGVITDMRLEGTTVTMDAVIGKRDLRFGPASSELGGQGIEELIVKGDRVRTVWRGIAGASVGIGACIPQAETVIETVYPDDFKMGGAHRATVEIVTPKMVRVIIGVDDTDTKEKGASWVTSLRMATTCPYGKFLEHKIVQLNPKAPNKTTNCCSTAASFAVEPKDVDKLIEAVNRCRDDVLLRSVDGREDFNLKSVLSRYVAIGELCRDHGDRYEIFCMNRADEGYMMHFFHELSEARRCA